MHRPRVTPQASKPRSPCNPRGPPHRGERKDLPDKRKTAAPSTLVSWRKRERFPFASCGLVVSKVASLARVLAFLSSPAFIQLSRPRTRMRSIHRSECCFTLFPSRFPPVCFGWRSAAEVCRLFIIISFFRELCFPYKKKRGGKKKKKSNWGR